MKPGGVDEAGVDEAGVDEAGRSRWSLAAGVDEAWLPEMPTPRLGAGVDEAGRYTTDYFFVSTSEIFGWGIFIVSVSFV